MAMEEQAVDILVKLEKLLDKGTEKNIFFPEVEGEMDGLEEEIEIAQNPNDLERVIDRAKQLGIKVNRRLNKQPVKKLSLKERSVKERPEREPDNEEVIKANIRKAKIGEIITFVVFVIAVCMNVMFLLIDDPFNTGASITYNTRAGVTSLAASGLWFGYFHYKKKGLKEELYKLRKTIPIRKIKRDTVTEVWPEEYKFTEVWPEEYDYERR